MLPGVGPGTVRQRIADLIVGDGAAIVRCQQVAPIFITVSIGDGIGGCYTLQTAGSAQGRTPPLGSCFVRQDGDSSPCRGSLSGSIG